jgi:hypothetical protein
MKEVQESDDALSKAEMELKRVKSIPKGKAGGGKGDFHDFSELNYD